MKPERAEVSQESLPNELAQTEAPAPDRSSDQTFPTSDQEKVSPTLRADKMTKRRKQDRLRLIGSTVILLLLLSLTSQTGRNWISRFVADLTSQSDSDEQNSERSGSILPVETIAVKPVNTYQVSRFYAGTLVPRRSSELSFERSGKVSQISIDEGDRVEAGTAIASLDPRMIEARKRELLAKRTQLVAQLEEMWAGPRPETITAARSTVKALSEQLELARQKSYRRETLYAQGAISREQLDEILFEASTRQARMNEANSQLDELLAGTRSEQIEAQQALIEQLDAEIDSLDIELQQSVLKAPFAGTISSRLLDEGTVVSAGQPILQLVEGGTIEARIGVPAAAASRLAVGSHQKIQIGQKTYQAKVSAILPELDSSTRTVTVVLTLRSVETEVTLGQVAKLELTNNLSTSGYWLPLSALVQGESGLWFCYVLSSAQVNIPSQATSIFRIEQRDVEIIHTESDRVLVRSNLQPGDQLIVSGTHRLVAGQLASPIATPQ